MLNSNPYSIRLELLKMAKEMLEAEYFGQREQISSDWNVKSEVAKIHGGTIPDHPGFPSYPTEADIIAKASALNGFVSNTPQDTTKPSKKST